MIVLDKATDQDAAHVTQHLRKADREELDAAYGISPEAAMAYSRERARVCMVWRVDNEPVCIFGVSELSAFSRTGYPWMVGTDELQRHKREILRNSRVIVQELLQYYPVLINWVDARNQESLRWLRWLGFEIESAAPWGAQSLPFHKVTLRVSQCA